MTQTLCGCLTVCMCVWGVRIGRCVCARARANEITTLVRLAQRQRAVSRGLCLWTNIKRELCVCLLSTPPTRVPTTNVRRRVRVRAPLRMHKGWGGGQFEPLDASCCWSDSTPCFALPLCALLAVRRVRLRCVPLRSHWSGQLCARVTEREVVGTDRTGFLLHEDFFQLGLVSLLFFFLWYLFEKEDEVDASKVRSYICFSFFFINQHLDSRDLSIIHLDLFVCFFVFLFQRCFSEKSRFLRPHRLKDFTDVCDVETAGLLFSVGAVPVFSCWEQSAEL